MILQAEYSYFRVPILRAVREDPHGAISGNDGEPHRVGDKAEATLGQHAWHLCLVGAVMQIKEFINVKPTIV